MRLFIDTMIVALIFIVSLIFLSSIVRYSPDIKQGIKCLVNTAECGRR